MMDWRKARTQLEDALRAAEEEFRRVIPHTSDFVVEILSATIRVEDAIRRIAPPQSIYIRQLNDSQRESILARCQYAIASGRALLGDVANGYMVEVSELVRADQFSDYLEMAEHLLAEGYKDAAAVIAGTSLEVHLRHLAMKSNVAIAKQDGTPLKANQINEDLAKARVYDKNEQKLVTGWLGVRNDAAHGDYGKVSEQNVGLMTKWVRMFISNNPA